MKSPNDLLRLRQMRDRSRLCRPHNHSRLQRAPNRRRTEPPRVPRNTGLAPAAGPQLPAPGRGAVDGREGHAAAFSREPRTPASRLASAAPDRATPAFCGQGQRLGEPRPDPGARSPPGWPLGPGHAPVTADAPRREGQHRRQAPTRTGSAGMGAPLF